MSEGFPDIVRVGGMLDVHYKHARMGHGRDAIKRLSNVGKQYPQLGGPQETGKK